MTSVAKYIVDEHIGILTVDSPPVNALGVAIRRGLAGGFRTLGADPAVTAIVVMCGGRTFFAGADITEFGKPRQEPSLQDVYDMIEHGSIPVIAAMHGTALGLGLEFAMVCHYRVAVPSARVGLPEVHLGLLPGGGGTQRLPRLVGVPAALEIMTTGRQINAAEAKALGLLDEVVREGHLREDAVAFARRILASGEVLPRVRDRQEKIEQVKGKSEIYSEFRKKNIRSFRGFKAPESIIRAVEAAATLPFEQGLAREWELFQELLNSTESAAQRYAFFAERETPKILDIPAPTPTLDIKTVGVIGAGTMGSGIAMNFLNAGMPVTLVEMNREALDRGVAVIRKNYEGTVNKGRLSADQVEARMALIESRLDLDALKAVDLVVEAVYESMEIKQDVFAQLDKVMKSGAILASNTSFLDLNQLARATSRPESVIGLHFFSPANVMRLLEVVRGAKTADSVIATAIKLSKRIGKVPVLSRVCDGFIANRLMRLRSIQAETLVLEGPSPADIDRVMYDYGFAMGHFQMMDLIGLDVIGRGAIERTLRGDFVAHGRLGQKNNKGFYDYDEKRNPSPSAPAAEIIANFATSKQIASSGKQSDEEVLARLLYPVINEGARILEEGIAQRASDIDMAAILGYNWPVYTGGPMFWADAVGLPKILAKLQEFTARYGDTFRPAPMLEKLVAAGKSFTRH
jgi:3-hydroxyacyl-CoA dehydrogenase